jgi:phage terminase large subunit-like protein
VRLERARRDVNAFCEFVMTGPDDKPWVQQPFHREWQGLLPARGPAHVVIVAPRESAKTSQMVGRVIWELGRDPNLRIKIVTSTDDLASDIVAAIGKQIQHNPRIRLVFPHLRPASESVWPKPGARANRLVVVRTTQEKDPSVSGHSILSTGTGGRADLIIFDDVVDLRNAISQPSLRDQVKRSFYEVWMNLLGPQGRAVYVATVWHEDDLTAELAGLGLHRPSPGWTIWCEPAINEATGELLWPDKWTAEALEARRAQVGARVFSRQFLLKPVADEEALFPESVLRVCLALGRGWEAGKTEQDEGWRRFIGVDLAISQSEKASYTVAFVIAVDAEKRRLPLEIVRRRQRFEDTVRMIQELFRKYRPVQIRVENNAYQEALLQHLRHTDPTIPVVGHTTGRQKADERIGLPGLAATMANGGWVIPCGGEPHPADCECSWCAWVGELRAYPVGAHDDTVMAMWLADAAAMDCAVPMMHVPGEDDPYWEEMSQTPWWRMY